MNPHVSVIIPVLNGEKYLAAAIESVLEQTARATQIIVIDDGSTDASSAIAEALAARYVEVQVVAQKNYGISAARNRGIEMAQGNFLALLDADDVWCADKLEKQLAAFEKNPALDLVFGYAQEFISPELPLEIQTKLKCETEPKPAMLPSALLVKCEAFWRVGLFETQWRAGEFANWILRADEVGLQRAMLPDLIMRRRIHSANNGIRQREKFNEYARMIKQSLDRRRAAGQDNP